MSDQIQTVSSDQSSAVPSVVGATSSQTQTQSVSGNSSALPNIPNPSISIPQPDPQVAASPMGYGHKEHGGFSKSEPTSVLKASEIEPVLTNEVKEVGVETQTDFASLPDESANAGMDFAKESVPVITEPTGMVTFPIPVATAQNVIKLHRKITDSIYWLAMLIIRQVQAKENRK